MNDGAEETATLWDLYCDWNGLPRGTPIPASLDAQRAKHTDDGLTHCVNCGGTWFNGSMMFTAEGVPVKVITPQKCVQCGELRRANWPT